MYSISVPLVIPVYTSIVLLSKLIELSDNKFTVIFLQAVAPINVLSL